MIHVVHNNDQSGPYPEDEIRQKLRSGDFLPTDLAWKEGMATWQPLREVLDPRTAAQSIAQTEKFTQYLSHVREWGGKLGQWLKPSVKRPAFIMLWGCAVVFLFQSCQMRSLGKQIEQAGGTNPFADSIVSVLAGYFGVTDPFTATVNVFNTFWQWFAGQAELQRLQEAYHTAELWRDLAVAAAIVTLCVVCFKSWRAKRRKVA